MHPTCPWKVKASYYNIVIDGKEYENGGWHYPTPKAAAKKISKTTLRFEWEWK